MHFTPMSFRATYSLVAWSVIATALAVFVPNQANAGEFPLVTQGKSAVVIYAPGENEPIGRRLADRLARFTGAKVEVATDVPPKTIPLVVVGTPRTNALVKELLATDARIEQLGDEGYLLKASKLDSQPALIAAGKTLAGAHHAISELVSWKLKLDGENAAVADDLDESDQPALRYRIVWTWDGHCNWAPTVEETMALYVNENPSLGSMAVPYTPEGFRTHFTRAVDYLSDHKLNGLIVWGFLRDEHGGVAMGREMSGYAKKNNVRILPGVCSQGGYGGFIYSQKSRFNLDVWCKEHPELQAKNEKGDVVAGMINPSHPENQKWLREGAEWLFTELPDIGGINLENGDFMSCYCDDCKAARAKPENDPNCLWDMATSQRPILEVAERMRPDGWMTFATYVGFSEAAARRAGKQAVYPPKFVDQVPPNAICQWTFTGMTTAQSWPQGLRPPKGKYKDQIGLLHLGSLWGAPVDEARWWTAPAAWNDEYSNVLPFVCQRAADSQFGGLAITGQNGDQCPAHELNFVALEYFSWHPERSYEQFHRDRLAVLYGGSDHATTFLKLLRNTSKSPEALVTLKSQALELAGSTALDLRQRARWKNLAGEMARREKLAAKLEQKPQP